MPESLQLVCKTNPFDRQSAVYAETAAGQTLAQMLGDGVSNTAHVLINGEPVPRELWAKVKPKAGTQIDVILMFQGGGGGKWLRMVMIVAVVALSIYAPYLAPQAWGTLSAAGTVTAAGALLSAGVMIAGMLMVNALIPPPTPKLGGASGDPFQQLQSITGTSNQINPYGVIPCLVGTYRFYPCHAALPYSEIQGDDQYLRMLLDLGRGDIDVSDIQIGDTPIDSYDGVQYEITTTPTLFTQDVNEVAVGAPFNATGDTTTRTTQANTTEISLDLVAPQGLFGVDAKGNTIGAQVMFSIQYRATGSTGAWTTVQTGVTAGCTSTGIDMSRNPAVVGSSVRKTLRCGVRWQVPKGQYDVTVTRAGDNFPNIANATAKSGDFQWSVLRSIAPGSPSSTGTLKLAMRIKASDQLNGSLPQVSVLAAQKIGTWNKAAQTWNGVAESQNPAWIYAWLLTRCEAIKRRLPDSRIDLDGIADWAAECDAKGYKTSFVMDSARAFSDVLADVLASGRASFGFRNGKYSAVRDLPQSVPVQMFTPANSWGFAYSRAFADLPHALRCKFVNPEAGYKQDYVTVYAPGYTAANATRFEELDLGPVVDPDAAWKLGMYHLAVIYNRPTQYVLNADIENMVCERGDMISVAHDVTGWGTAWGRVIAIDGQSITLDGPVTLETGKTYRLRARTVDANTVSVDLGVANITNAAGTYTELALATALTAAPGDAYVVGEVNQEVAQLIVRQIEPDSDLNAKLTCVDAAPQVWTADAGTPPPFVSNITNTAWCEAPQPPQLQLVVNPARATSGASVPGINVGLPPQGGIYRQPVGSPGRFGLAL